MNNINIRQSQVTYTYAPGAIGDFPGVSGIFLSHDYNLDDWGKHESDLDGRYKQNKRRIIVDRRLSNAFGIENFVLPPLEFTSNSLKIVRFPLSMYCPNCGTIHFSNNLEKYKQGYIPQNGHPITFDDALRAYFCVYCLEERNIKIELVPTRFIIANEEGFIDDFPWDWYVHRKEEFKKYRGQGHILKLVFGTSSASLGSIEIKSFNKTTGEFITSESLGEIFNQDLTFIAKNDEYLDYVKNYMPKPWLGREGDSYIKKLIHDVPRINTIERDVDGKIVGDNATNIKRKYPRTLQRGANNLYFPLVFKGIRLPEGSNIYNSSLIERIIETKKELINISPDDFEQLDNKGWKDFFINSHKTKTNPYLLRFSIEELSKTLDSIFPVSLNDNNASLDKKQQLRLEEFTCFNDTNVTLSYSIWYKAKHLNKLNEYLSDIVKVKQITLLEKLNELKAFRGFTRIRPISNEDLIFESDSNDLDGNKLLEYNRICDARKNPLNTNELPCSEVKGEGIFIKFNNKSLIEWEKKESVRIRFSKMLANLESYFDKFGVEDGLESISARYVFLHTFSHLIMQQLASDSGYSLSSITEIIYCNKPTEENLMNGILIYTSSSDTEGTLGGLVEKGYPDRLQPIISKAIDKAKWCSSDPLCITSKGQGFMATNMAACYSCVMVPETSCENINKFLDRKLVLDFFGIESLE